MRWIKAIIKGINGFSTITANTTRWLVLIIVSITVYDVVMRYFFNSPTVWAYELSGWLLGPLWLLGGAYVLLHDEHVRLDILYKRFTPRKRAIIDLVTFTLFLFYCSLILIYGWDYFLYSFAKNEHSLTVWGPPIWPLKLMIPVGAAFILLQGVAKYIRDFHMAVTGRQLE
jgi:TRAP-type mannitol/chloroaromatic compound transport system permease small subunit